MEEIKKGMKVEILTKNKEKVIGIVEDIGVKRNESLPLMVRLKSGEIGRVQRVIDGKIKTEIEELVKKKESSVLEFKAEALWSLNYKEHEIKESKSYELRTFRQKASKVIIAKSIAALMNLSLIHI